MTAIPSRHSRVEGARPRALFVGSTYAGHATRFANMERHVREDSRLQAEFVRVTGWKEGGAVERLTFIPPGARGRMRATFEAATFARVPRPDVVWTSASEVLTPYLWAQAGRWRRPLVLDLDATRDQLEKMAPYYKNRPPKSGAVDALARKRERLLWSRVSLFTPWSNWAADGLRGAGVAEERICVIPPGVDLDLWHPSRRTSPVDRPIRLLFVGGDFGRKGGDMLLDVMRSPLGAEFELDIVTRGQPGGAPNTRVHHFEANSTGLRELYARADVFVMPSKAECFGLATIEAMAAGLPVIVSDTGGARDIVVPHVTGWLIRPTAAELSATLRALPANKASLQVVGQRAREHAETRFDDKQAVRRLTNLMLSLSEARSRRLHDRMP